MTFALVAAVLGWSGTAALLTAHGLVSAGRLSGRGTAFQWLNIYGSGGLGVAAVEGAVWSAVTLNAVWVAIGVLALLTAARRNAGTPKSSPAPAPATATAHEGAAGRPTPAQMPAPPGTTPLVL